MLSSNGATPHPVVAIDAMGGDKAPLEVVKGAADAQRQGANVVLVGIATAIEPILDDLRADVRVVDAPEVIGMDDAVTRSLFKARSSLRVAVELVEEGDAAAVVSCGNSAAIMALALRHWGGLPGIDRPAFGGFLPSRNGMTFVLDIGANAEVDAENLVQFAQMADVYVRLARGIGRPRVGLLSNGSEDSKGTTEIKEAHEALRKLDLNFIGNIEGNSVFEGDVDVVVCDGFSGNVLLKTAEGVVTEVFALLREEVTKDLVSKLAAQLMMPALTRIKRRVDYEEYGGVPVLGVNSLMINCHGRSTAKAVTNAILLADRMATEKLTERIGDALHPDGSDGGRTRRIARALHLRPTT